MKISYNKKIQLVKFALLSIIVLIVLSFLIIPTVYIKIRSSGYLFAASMISNLLKKDISPPVISGTTKQGGAYYLSAAKVTNNLFDLNKQEGGIITVTKPTLLYTTNKKNTLFTITSSEATINTGTRIIDIPNTVNITSNQNYSATLQEVTIDIKNDSIITENPVKAKFGNKSLVANGLTAQKGGNIVTFKGPIEITTINKNIKNTTKK